MKNIICCLTFIIISKIELLLLIKLKSVELSIYILGWQYFIYMKKLNVGVDIRFKRFPVH